MSESDPSAAKLSVEGIGGIDTCEVTFEKGVTILSGENATNRTSLLTALAGVLGSSAVTIKGGRDKGFASLEVDTDTYTRSYTRQDGNVIVEGDPYTNKTELVDLFSAILEDNPIRQAVERREDLSDVLMRPVDADQIERRINERIQERDRVDKQIAEIEQDRRRFPKLEEQRQELQAELENVETEIEQFQATIDEYDQDIDVVEGAQKAMNELEDSRNEFKDVEQAIETQRSSIDALREERNQIRSKLDDLSVPDETTDDIKDRLTGLKQKERSLSNTINTLSGIVEFSEKLLDSDTDQFNAPSETDDITTALNPVNHIIECWACGNNVPRQEIESNLDEIRDTIDEKRAEHQETKTEVNESQSEVVELREQRNRGQRLESELEDINAEIERREGRIDDFQEKASRIQDTILKVETKIKETEELRENDLVESYQKVSELEYRHGQLEQELCSIENEIEDLKEAANKRARLKTQRQSLTDEIEDLRTRIENLEEKVVIEFNEHISEVISLLAYKNIERVWIERKKDPQAGSEIKSISTFRVHVVRETADGTVYEDSVRTLSESEREVLGLIIALAGYLAHEVYDSIPFILLDSLEAIDSDRIAKLVDYIAEFSPFLIVSLLAEDARALDDEYRHVSATQFRSTIG